MLEALTLEQIIARVEARLSDDDPNERFMRALSAVGHLLATGFLRPVGRRFDGEPVFLASVGYARRKEGTAWT